MKPSLRDRRGFAVSMIFTGEKVVKVRTPKQGRVRVRKTLSPGRLPLRTKVFTPPGRKVGRGSHGVVYDAGPTKVLKAVSFHRVAGRMQLTVAETRARFEQQVWLMRQLAKRSIGPLVYEAYVCPGKFGLVGCVVMQKLAASLAEVDAVAWQPVCDCLRFVAEVYHDGDVKLNNMMVDAEGKVYKIDPTVDECPQEKAEVRYLDMLHQLQDSVEAKKKKMILKDE